MEESSSVSRLLLPLLSEVPRAPGALQAVVGLLLFGVFELPPLGVLGVVGVVGVRVVLALAARVGAAPRRKRLVVGRSCGRSDRRVRWDDLLLPQQQYFGFGCK